MGKEKQTTVLVCARADSPLMVRGADFRKTCRGCNSRVMVAPSGQKLMEQNPDAHIVCSVCFLEATKSGALPPHEKIKMGLAGPVDEIASEISGAVPNTWKRGDDLV